MWPCFMWCLGRNTEQWATSVSACVQQTNELKYNDPRKLFRARYFKTDHRSYYFTCLCVLHPLSNGNENYWKHRNLNLEVYRCHVLLHIFLLPLQRLDSGQIFAIVIRRHGRCLDETFKRTIISSYIASPDCLCIITPLICLRRANSVQSQ